MKKYINISDVLWFQEGPGVRNTQYTTDGVKLLNVTNLINGNVDTTNTNRYISKEEAYGKYKHFLADEGDLVIASSGIKVEYFDKKMGFIRKEQLPLCMNTSTIRFKVTDEKRLSIRYFMYYLKSNHFKEQLGKQITGSAQLNFGPSHLKKMVFPLIEMEEQAKIIDKLDTIYDIEYKMRTELKLYDQLASSLFIEMFGDPISNSKKWTIKRLVELSILITNGTTPSGGSENYIDSGVVFLRSQNVWKNRIDLEDTVYISSSLHKIMNKSRVIYNDILITKTGRINTENSSLGRAAIYKEKNKEANINGHVYLIRLKDTVNPEYILSILTGEAYREYIRRVCVGGIDKRQINLNHVEDFPIIVPPLDLQNRFAEYVSSIDKSKYSSFSHLSA